MTARPVGLGLVVMVVAGCAGGYTPVASTERVQALDQLSALWSFYKYRYIDEGRVVSHDEDGITTSEGQSYALLRAVWSGDWETFESVWQWTQDHLQVRDDQLFAWKWKGRVLDINSATDADVDIALALILAAHRFDRSRYQNAAQRILADIWRHDVAQVGDAAYVTAGNWAPPQHDITLHVAYLAPYAYELFAQVDPERPWRKLVASSYRVLHWLYDDLGVTFPPDIVYLEKATGHLKLRRDRNHRESLGTYDIVPLPWRLAVDAQWFNRDERPLRRRVLEGYRQTWQRHGQLFDKVTTAGRAQSTLEGLPHTATAYALATVEDPVFAQTLYDRRMMPLWDKALRGQDTPYYLHNWLWFSHALALDQVRPFDTLRGLLGPLDTASLLAQVPWGVFLLTLLAYFGAHRWRWARLGFFGGSALIILQYLGWRATASLNFIEPVGPGISIALLLAEIYSVSTVVLLMVQLGTRKPAEPAAVDASYVPTVDIFIPIYSEPLEILERTVLAAKSIDHPRSTVHVLDDSHQEAVRALCAQHGIGYVRGPRRHAKAGNLNNALKHTDGELVVVFDTDHIPSRDFLRHTVPHFANPAVGMAQTPHHFYNQDIFQRAFITGERLPNEQDMFNHAIQSGRNTWGGAFFVGSGAVFRREALVQNGGFNLMSITEDIHTSQCLHARGWKSVFVDRDMAVGLTAEDYPSYLVQRSRWMQGCLQIFFRDNPLLKRGLPWRHRLGYFASLYYFLFPLPRLIYWLTPLYFLLFHWHPLLGSLNTLLALLLPYMVVLPLMGQVLLPRWPRMGWGVLYELAVTFPLLRAMAAMLLPRSIGFKVTPKGVVSAKRSFNWTAAAPTVAAMALTLFAIGKGLWEFSYFGIERDAYLINLGWATYNAVFLGAALLVAWDRPQQRREERLAASLFVRVAGEPQDLGQTLDASPRGFALMLPRYREFPARLQMSLSTYDAEWTVTARLVYNEPVGRGRFRVGFEIEEAPSNFDDDLVLRLYADPERWRTSHDRHLRSNWLMFAHFVTSLPRAWRRLVPRQRRWKRQRQRKRLRWLTNHGVKTLWLTNMHPYGCGIVGRGEAPEPGERICLLDVWPNAMTLRVVYCRRLRTGWRAGLARDGEAQPETELQGYMVAAS